MERITNGMRGYYRDRLIDPEGRIILDRGWQSNMIVDRCRILLAGFVRNHTEESWTGIAYLAVGQGDPQWDSAGIPASDPAATIGLQDPNPFQIPTGRLEIEYLNSDDEVVAEPTSRLQITASLAAGEPPPAMFSNVYELREFGLFGRLNGVDYMINSIRHPVIPKDRSATLIRVIRLYF